LLVRSSACISAIRPTWNRSDSIFKGPSPHPGFYRRRPVRRAGACRFPR
jgi:hypothetical protein